MNSTPTVIGIQIGHKNFDKCIIVDIDGTLADERERRVHYQECAHLPEKERLEKYYSHAKKDKVHSCIHEIIENFKHTHNIVLLTARSTELNKITIDWLNENNIHRSALFMKPHQHDGCHGDYKVEACKYIEKLYGKITFCLEDQIKITHKLRDAGYVCFQVRDSYLGR